MSGARRLADLLEIQGEHMMDESCRTLASMDNAVVREGDALEQLRQNYGAILRDVTRSLRSGRVEMDESYKRIAWEIGVARASAGIHPGESMQAGSVFYATVLSRTAALLAGETDALEIFGLAALALQTSVSERVREGFAIYTSYLLNKVYVAQTEERQRIARDLHDQIGHNISVAHHQLELSELYRVKDQHGTAAAKARTAHRAVLDAMSSLRSVASGLHASRPHRSLESALAGDLREIDTTGIDIRIRVNGDEAWAERHVLDECTLMLREAARNALEHGRPSFVMVNIDITPAEIRALVEDNGIGFDQTRTGGPGPAGAAAGGGVGLAAMRERAELLGGLAAIDSRPGAGTRVRFVIPLRDGGPG